MRHTAKPPAETRLFFADAIANGQRVWWHVLGAELYDRRWLDGVADYFSWLAEVEPFLRNECSLADVALVWSPPTFWLAAWQPMQPSPWDAFNGWYHALLEGRVPFDLLPVWKLNSETVDRYRTLILPSQTLLPRESLSALDAYVARGGGIVACFEAGWRNEWGEPNPADAWTNVMGVQRLDDPPPALRHCYMRVRPSDRMHPLLQGLGDTDVLPGSAYLSRVVPLAGTEALLAFVPTYPVHPPEKVYPDPKETDVALVFCHERNGRVVHLAMDVDAAYWRSRLPDHRWLLLRALDWVRKGTPLPVTVQGTGLVEVTAWRQRNSLTVHLVNLTTPNLFGGPVTEIVPVGEQKIQLVLPNGCAPAEVRLLRANQTVAWQVQGERLTLTVPQVIDHEIVAITLA